MPISNLGSQELSPRRRICPVIVDSPLEASVCTTGYPRAEACLLFKLNRNTLVRMTGVANEKPREIIWFNGGYQARAQGVADLPREQLNAPNSFSICGVTRIVKSIPVGTENTMTGLPVAVSLAASSPKYQKVGPFFQRSGGSHFLSDQPAKVDSPMQRMIHHEDAETAGSGIFRARLAFTLRFWPSSTVTTVGALVADNHFRAMKWTVPAFDNESRSTADDRSWREAR